LCQNLYNILFEWCSSGIWHLHSGDKPWIPFYFSEYICGQRRPDKEKISNLVCNPLFHSMLWMPGTSFPSYFLCSPNYSLWFSATWKLFFWLTTCVIIWRILQSLLGLANPFISQFKVLYNSINLVLGINHLKLIFVFSFCFHLVLSVMLWFSQCIFI
jgi:hypothetical protein